MSEGHFHVHGPHDHEVEHAAHSGDPLAGRIAMMTAIFATIGALYGYMAGATQNDALLFKNEAAIRTLEASDQWNFYQAKSSKQNLAELGATLTTGDVQSAPAAGSQRLAVARACEPSSRDCATPAKPPKASMHRRWVPPGARSSGASRVRRRAGCVPATTPSIRRAK